MKQQLTCVDLFCGAGGFSRGFLDAGYDVVLGVDYDDAALETFQRNHGNTHAMKLDLYDEKNIDVIVQYLKSIGISDLDVLIGGPPCQGFSYAGKMEIDDKRNFLYLAMVKLTERLKPKAVLLENVLALVEAHGRVGAKRIIDDFSGIGYNMTKEVAELLTKTKNENHKIIAVGTTSTRTLETIMTKYGEFKECNGWTNIFIYPGYKFKAIDNLITNFHLPKSTLVMLVSALAGKENILNAYNEAIKNKYRFFSFGDAMLIKE